MKAELKGTVLKTIHTRAHGVKMAELEKTLGTATAAETARVALFFGITATGDLEIVEKFGLDLSRGLLGGHGIRWRRPFEPDEEVVIEISLADVFDKGKNRFAVVESVFSTPGGEEIQRQTSTFIQPAA